MQFLFFGKSKYFIYRKNKRDAASFILDKLLSKNIKQSTGETLGREFKSKYYGSSTLSKIAKLQNSYDNDLLYNAMILLAENKHVETEIKDDKNKFETTTLTLTPEGEDACRGGFYDLENKKDAKEERERWATWVLPIVSIIISIAALSVNWLNSQKPNETKILPQILILPKDTTKYIDTLPH